VSKHKDLRRLQNLLREFATLENSLVNSQGLPLQVARLFVAICIHSSETDEVSTSDVNDLLGFNSATLSRNINTLSNRPKRSGTGLGLILTNENPLDRRSKLIKLTAKGKTLQNKLLDIMKG